MRFVVRVQMLFVSSLGELKFSSCTKHNAGRGLFVKSWLADEKASAAAAAQRSK